MGSGGGEGCLRSPQEDKIYWQTLCTIKNAELLKKVQIFKLQHQNIFIKQSFLCGPFLSQNRIERKRFFYSARIQTLGHVLEVLILSFPNSSSGIYSILVLFSLFLIIFLSPCQVPLPDYSGHVNAVKMSSLTHLLFSLHLGDSISLVESTIPLMIISQSPQNCSVS